MLGGAAKASGVGRGGGGGGGQRDGRAGLEEGEGGTRQFLDLGVLYPKEDAGKKRPSLAQVCV